MNEAQEILPLELQKVFVERGGKEVLKDITCSFGITPTRTLIVGPNGAGKSLLLRVCHGVMEPDRGSIRWAKKTGSPAVAKMQAMVFQRPVLLRRSVRQNIAYALKVRGVFGIEQEERSYDALKRTGLWRFSEAPARSLSFGEQQRLALARALAVRPRILFLDEPTASLDPAAAHMVEQLVLELSSSGIRIIMSSHDLNQARRLAQEVVFMNRGRIKERSLAEEFFSSPGNDLARAFLNGELLWRRRRSLFD